jgi:GNAT superfamily N-acetyltransferase
VNAPGIRVEPVRSDRDRKEFIELPFRLYRDDPNWVPPLRRDVRELIDPAKHPFHQHASVELFLARKGDEIVGRIAAIRNELQFEVHHDKTGFFGLFECIRDEAVARALLDTARDWLSSRGLDNMRGPASFSLNEEAGLLIDGFNGPPVVMMTYNPPWYADLFEAYGLRKSKDLVAYWYPDATKPSPRLLKVADRLRARYNVTLRTLDKKNFWNDVAIVRRVYNEAWEDNWGHIPMTKAELDYMAKQLKPVVEPSLVVFAEVNGELAGFGLALPDLNVALKHMNGSLFPFGWAKALWYSRKIHVARTITLGVLAKHRRSGVAELLMLEMMINAAKKGIVSAEFSWVLEDNMMMRQSLEKVGARIYRTYRMYDMAIGA